jgi:hypothetical protein
VVYLFGLTSIIHLSVYISMHLIHIYPLCSLVNNAQSYLFSLTSVAHFVCARQLQLLVIPSGLTSVAHLLAQTSMQGMHTYPLVAYSGICAHSSTLPGHISSISLQSLIPCALGSNFWSYPLVWLQLPIFQRTQVCRACIYITFSILRHLCSLVDNYWPRLFGLTSVAHPQQSSQLWTATTFTSFPLALLYHGHFLHA